MDKVKIVRVPLRVANSYLLIGKKAIIVDTGDPGYSKHILHALQANDIKKSDVSMIFLTHGHIDHFGSVYELKRQLDVPVAIHRIDEPYLLEGIQAPLYPQNALAGFIKAIGKDFKVKKRYGLKAEIIFDDELDLNCFGIDARAVSTPGHTMGSASLLLKPGAAIVGDLLVHKYLLFGKACKPPFCHDKLKYSESIYKLLDLGVTMFYPGHGKAIHKNELLKTIAAVRG
ncbi:MAG: MBL fold metallo-hydrolase [Syntrophomonadaceae bacterium]|nr:MBL fold metallo-hydrolase [Syntrophomonadaceae bacterium]